MTAEAGSKNILEGAWRDRPLSLEPWLAENHRDIAGPGTIGKMPKGVYESHKYCWSGGEQQDTILIMKWMSKYIQLGNSTP